MPTAVVARPASSFEPLVLLAAVREVAELSGAPKPEMVSTRVWDRSRPLSERFADAPPARRICEHLRLKWPQVLRLAFLDDHARGRALGLALNEQFPEWLTAGYCDFILRLVARRLSVETLTPAEYRAESRRMLSSDRARWMHGGQFRVPTDDQIEAVTGSWDRALANAGLRSRYQPERRWRKAAPLTISEMLDRCYEFHGSEPTVKEADVFARANGLSVKRRSGRPWRDWVADWKQSRRDRGLPVPAGPPPFGQRPDYSQDVGAAKAHERRGRHRWNDRDEVIDWVARYLRTLTGRARGTQRGYLEWATVNSGAPYNETLAQYGGWAAVRDAAWALIGRDGGVRPRHAAQ